MIKPLPKPEKKAKAKKKKVKKLTATKVQVAVNAAIRRRDGALAQKRIIEDRKDYQYPLKDIVSIKNIVFNLFDECFLAFD